MAIQNASDLLVYAKTASTVAQVTRIYVKETSPLTSTGTLTINNIVNSSGVINDNVETGSSNNDGASVLAVISTVLVTDKGYTQSAASVVQGDYRYREYTGGTTGKAPTLEIVDGTATLVDDAIIIEIITPGSSAVYDPVAFSTSASFSQTVDTIDCTNKDSGGYSEYKAGLKSFEVSTELLQSVNPDVPLDGTDFFHELSERDEVNIAFSDRQRNFLTTNTTQSGVGGFLVSGVIQTLNQTDPFGGTTASKIENDTNSLSRIQLAVDAQRIEARKLTWSFYVRGDGTNTKATINIPYGSLNDATLSTVGGNGSETISAYSAGGSGFYKIENLDTTWVRVLAEFPGLYDVKGLESTVYFRVLPGLSAAQSGESIYVSSWQLEHSNNVTDYQDPTSVTYYHGNAFVTSINFDAGVEDNVTCSATFTGTGITTLNQ